MTTRRPRTAQIKPATRNAIMDQLALAASEIERLRSTTAQQIIRNCRTVMQQIWRRGRQ